MTAKTEAQRGEILVPHDPDAGEVTEVRNLLLQSSLAELKANGYYDRYVKCIAPSLLEEAPCGVRPRERVLSAQRLPGHDHRLAW